MLKKLLVAPFAVLLFVGAGCTTETYVDGNVNVNGPVQGACTMDAQECPDGSYVGRVPPSCEFAPCPAVTGNVNGGVMAP